MKIITNIFLLFFLCLFFSCSNDNNNSDKLLKEAQALTVNNPVRALVILDSIENPERMNKDDYMQYAITRVESKYKTYQDVSGDTLIFEAQKHFDKKCNYEQATLANYYAGGVYREKKMPDKALESFLNAGYYDLKSGDNPLLSAKISENIGALYFEQSLRDSSIIYYKKALVYYKKVEGTKIPVLKVNNIIGRAFEDLGQFDSAYVYFEKALTIADRLNNAPFQSAITQNLGIVSYDMKEYDQAILYFKTALNMEATTPKQIKKINIALLNTYIEKKNIQSAKQYVDTLVANLSISVSEHTNQEMYNALSNYYKLTEDYKQALYYFDLKVGSTLKIEQEEQLQGMLIAEKNYSLNMKDREKAELQAKIYFLLFLLISAILSFLITSILFRKRNKRDKEIIRLQVERYNEARDYIAAHSKDDKNKEAEITAIMKDIDKE